MADVKYTYEFQNEGGLKYRVDIIPTGYTGDPITLYPAPDGLTWEYKGMQSEVYQPFIACELTCTLINDANAYQMVLDMIYEEPIFWYSIVNRWNGATYVPILRFKVNTEGLILPDASTAPPVAALTIKADDGFGYLEQRNHDDTEPQFMETFSLLYPFYKAIDIMTGGLLIDTDDPFLAMCSNWYEQHMEQDVDIDPFSKLYIDGKAFVEADDFGITKGMSWRDILENILVAFNLTMFQNEGLYYIIQLNSYLNQASLKKYVHFKRTVDDPEDYSMSAIFTGNIPLPVRFSGGEFSNIAANTKVTSEYNYKSSIYGNSLLPATIAPSPITVLDGSFTHEVYDLCQSEEGYPMHIQGSAVATIRDTGVHAIELYVYIEFKIKCGSYFLNGQGNNPNNAYWSLTEGQRIRATSEEFAINMSTITKTVEFNIDLPALPTSGDDVTFEVDNVYLYEYGADDWVEPDPGHTFSFSLEFQNDWSANIGTAGQMAGREGYIAESAPTNQYELKASCIGDAGYNFHVSKLRVKNISDVVENTTLWARLGGTYEYNLHEFRAYEMLGNSGGVMQIFQTTLYGEIPILSKYVFDTAFWAVIGSKYYANDNKTEVTLMRLYENYETIVVSSNGVANGNQHSSGGTYVGSGAATNLWRRTGIELTPFNVGDNITTSGAVGQKIGADDYSVFDAGGLYMSRTSNPTRVNTQLKGTFLGNSEIHERVITSPDNIQMAVEQFKAAGDQDATNGGCTYELSTTKENDTSPTVRIKVDKDGKVILNESGDFVGVAITPLSSLDIKGSHGYTVRTASATATLDANDFIFIATANTFTVNLPDATTCENRAYIIKNKGAGTITVDPYSTQSIDDSSTRTVATGAGVMIISDGNNWFVILG